jgi:hypothetical protein
MPTTASFEYTTIQFSTRAGEYGEDSTITETRHIRKLNGTAFNIDTDSTTAENEGALPRRGDKAYPSGTGLTWQQFARFRGYTVDQLPNAAGARFTLNWSSRYVLTLSGSPVVAYYALPSSVDFSSQARSTRIYRTGWSTSPPAASDASSDIGGTATMGGNDGMAWNVGQTRIRMRFEQDATVVSVSAAASSLTGYTNCISSATFLGCPAGSLICEGVTVNPIRYENYEVTFDLLYDPWYHHEQVPTLAADGRPTRTSNNLAEVKWKRLPRTSTDFNNIYAGDTKLKTITERGYPLP